MQQKEKIFTIKEVENLYNSYTGGPRLKITLTDGQNDYIAKTPTNSPLGYKIGLSWEKRQAKIKYHYTTSNNMIIDEAERL